MSTLLAEEAGPIGLSRLSSSIVLPRQPSPSDTIFEQNPIDSCGFVVGGSPWDLRVPFRVTKSVGACLGVAVEELLSLLERILVGDEGVRGMPVRAVPESCGSVGWFL